MHIELEINDEKANFFLEYIHSLKEGIVESVKVSEGSFPFEVSSVEEVRRRVRAAEESGDYIEHDKFWKEMGA